MDKDGNTEKLYYDEENELYNRVFPANEELKREQHKQKTDEEKIEEEFEFTPKENLKENCINRKLMKKKSKKNLGSHLKNRKIS